MASRVKPEVTFVNEELQHINDDLTLCKNAPKPLDRAFSSGDNELPERSILQVVAIENVAVPKKDQSFDGHEGSSKRKLLKVTLTDGTSSCDALLTQPHPLLKEDTIPGTKVRILRKTKLSRRMFMVNGGAKEIEVLGGVVPALKEKWLHGRTRNAIDGWSYVPRDGKDGPPLWKPFGYKTQIVVDKQFRTAKAMDLLKPEGDEEKKDGEFEAQRKEAISELAKVGPKKFGAGKQLIEKELVYLMEKGFDLNEASEAYNRFKNPQKALKHLQLAHGIEVPLKAKEEKPEKKVKKKGRRRDEEDDDYDDGEVPVHRANNISLFGFISQQMNLEDATEPTTAPQESNERDSYQRQDNRGRGRGFRGRGDRGGRRGEPNRRFQSHQPDNRQDEETLFQLPRTSYSRGNDHRNNQTRFQNEQKPFDPSSHNFPRPNWSEESNVAGSRRGSRNNHGSNAGGFNEFNRSSDYYRGLGNSRDSGYNTGSSYSRGADYTRHSENSPGSDYSDNNSGSGYRGGLGFSRGSNYNRGSENKGGSRYSRGDSGNSRDRGSDFRGNMRINRDSDRCRYDRGHGSYGSTYREYSRAPSETMSSFKTPQPPQQTFESDGDYERKPNYSTTYYNSSRRGNGGSFTISGNSNPATNNC